ncbi:MAG: preprotein translocase subunit SecG [Succiniclasticum sp.]|jgi:preprotein translocase subunit SecG|uniref:Protein-export membrane protein SecG n=1 Tax=Succiniclasticum ruminis TaxID=40841 RepID=A0A1G6NZN2_9FIRM|nr:preprotein translocase subunit SecG [Succiniclasticum ruminis]MBQ1777359.1 preprotein translocase subunit SecG [Acidaminococcaceae bacterium]MEE3396425.1 preprotein translocase subunit SecG [Succiniclasticum sp.]MBQ2141011.1 preprotein translocase subunit SecG [Acidaminococcaceae bacterium]MBQ2220860.1 preprotein translocase subunit SecG [Acidaminococcaceae bacterium]MBQ2343009.1 preprotein translocase subunit SecG [Acidaminococcaceae bacterium]
MLETVLMVVDFIVCVALIGAVLLQTGRGAGLSSSFGGGDGAFFGKGNDLDTVLSKATIVLGTAFGVITLALAKLNA